MRLWLFRLWFTAVVLSPAALFADVLRVGAGQPYADIEDAAADAQPGDTIAIQAGVYPGGRYMENLHGTTDAWITITGEPGQGAPTTMVDGGGECWHLTDARYVRIERVLFRGASSNLVNIDDGGTYDTPAHHIVVAHCAFDDGNPDHPNADPLKLSGVDTFRIENCSFVGHQGTGGGSGIDMVGCHDGVITGCTFLQMKSNSIQAKGGTRNIDITRCLFREGGARAVNIGGSTGAPYFRPIDANYEAADIDVFSNVFIDSGPIAFVGSVRSRVINNTIVRPTKWALRILQETTTPGFLPCSDNTFGNNIVYLGGDVTGTVVNIGPNTQPETFTFWHNLWYHSGNLSWPGPDLPVEESAPIINEAPLFVDLPSGNVDLQPGSPAIGAGSSVEEPTHDFHGIRFGSPPSIGAVEGAPVGTTVEHTPAAPHRSRFRIVPTPCNGTWTIHSAGLSPTAFIVYAPDGRELERIDIRSSTPAQITTSLPPGLYFLVPADGTAPAELLIITR